jgi:hypothetical protein
MGYRDNSHHREQTRNMRPIPKPETEDIKAIWRVGLVAFREERRRDPGTRKDLDAGQAAILAAFPNLTPPAYRARRGLAHREHHEWLYRGVRRREWIWPPDHRGVGVQRNPGFEDT